MKIRSSFWMEFKKERYVNKRIEGEDGVHLRGKEEVKGVWKSHFENLMNENT